MARIDPAFIPTLTDLTRGLRELDVPFCIIGALVPELLLDSGSARMTNDADVTVVDDGERYGLDYAGEGVPFEYTCAYLLGQDCRRFLDPAVTAAARAVLDRFESADSSVVRMILRENGRHLPERESLESVLRHFRWFRLGAGL